MGGHLENNYNYVNKVHCYLCNIWFGMVVREKR